MGTHDQSSFAPNDNITAVQERLEQRCLEVKYSLDRNYKLQSGSRQRCLRVLLLAGVAGCLELLLGFGVGAGAGSGSGDDDPRSDADTASLDERLVCLEADFSSAARDAFDFLG